MEYKDYLALLSELEQTMESLTKLQSRKIEAVRSHDLDELNECMKQEQAVSLSLRGMEHRRDKLLKELGMSGISIREMTVRCPAEHREATAAATEQLLRQYEQLHSAQEAARTVVEKDLRRVNRELEHQGVEIEPEAGYQAPPGTPPNGMRTDFRA